VTPRSWGSTGATQQNRSGSGGFLNSTFLNRALFGRQPPQQQQQQQLQQSLPPGPQQQQGLAGVGSSGAVASPRRSSSVPVKGVSQAHIDGGAKDSGSGSSSGGSSGAVGGGGGAAAAAGLAATGFGSVMEVGDLKQPLLGPVVDAGDDNE
jgi:hypothetical protein